MLGRAGILVRTGMFCQCSRMPYERVILGPRYSVRLEEVQATDAIDAECMGCLRKRRVAPHRLLGRYQGYVRLQQIGKESVCHFRYRLGDGLECREGLAGNALTSGSLRMRRWLSPDPFLLRLQGPAATAPFRLRPWASGSAKIFRAQ